MADLQICTCQLIFRTEGPCVPTPKSTRRARALLPWGFHGRGEGIRPLHTHQLFYFKNACDPAAPVRLAVACCAAHLRAPRRGWLRSLSLWQTGRGPPGGARSLPMTAQISSLHLELSQRPACPRDKGNGLICKCQLASFLGIFSPPFEGGILSAGEGLSSRGHGGWLIKTSPG